MSFERRIARNTDDKSTLQNNIALDTNISERKDGKSIPAALFTQRYFEHTMDWDFDSVWQWNSSENRPELQSVGVGATTSSGKRATSTADTEDLLTQQVKANIWL